MPPSEVRPSITFTALIGIGMLLVLGGAVIAILGLGAPTLFALEYDKFHFKTSNCGLAIAAIGAILAGTVATRLPANVAVFGLHKPTIWERLAARASQLLLIGVVLLIVALVLARFSAR